MTAKKQWPLLHSSAIVRPMSKAIAGLLFTLFSVTCLAESNRMTLDQSYQAALKQSEIVREQAEGSIQSEEHTRQAKGAILPTINLTATYFDQDTPKASLATAVSPSSQNTVKIGATQPLFRGFREFAYLRQSKNLEASQKETESFSRTTLYRSVAENYFTILLIEQQMKNIDIEINLFHDQIHELTQRIRIGRSRETEVLTVDSQQLALAAQKEQLQGQLKTARESFQFLTGVDANQPLDDASQVPSPSDQGLDFFLGKLESRPDVKAASQKQLAAAEGIKIASGAHLPSLDLAGNYYPVRTGLYSGYQWDAQLALTLPIYAGGTTESQVRESSSIERQSDLEVARIRRGAQQDVRSYYENMKAFHAAVLAFQRSEVSSEKSYQQTHHDYRMGLANNLDVIQALITYQASQQSLDSIRLNEKLNLIELQIASGLPPGATPTTP